MTRPIQDPDDPSVWMIGEAAEPVHGIQSGPTILHRVHPESVCAGRACVIHRPSEHRMRDWPLNWRADRRIMERICLHGIGHPDPDQLPMLQGMGMHGCDGCCVDDDDADQ